MTALQAVAAVRVRTQHLTPSHIAAESLLTGKLDIATYKARNDLGAGLVCPPQKNPSAAVLSGA